MSSHENQLCNLCEAGVLKDGRCTNPNCGQRPFTASTPILVGGRDDLYGDFDPDRKPQRPVVDEELVRTT